MGHVDDAFAKLKHNLEITTTEQNQASSRRQAIYDHVKTTWDIDRAFLTGSYDRHTKTKKLKDVDIFVVIDSAGAQAGLRSPGPAVVLADLKAILEVKYPGKVKVDSPACVVTFGTDDIMSFEIVPAFDTGDGVYEIPDVARGGWMKTNPELHATATTAKNKACAEKWIPFVKMIKGMNREAGEPISPSFLIEVMALDLIREPFGRYQDEIATFLASAAEQVTDDWKDPADIGPSVNGGISATERANAATKLREWQLTAEAAIDLEDAGSERAAVDKWRELFGNRMPKP